METMDPYQIPNLILRNPHRLFYFKRVKNICRLHGYLSELGKAELETAGNVVINEGDCWIIKPQEGC